VSQPVSRRALLAGAGAFAGGAALAACSSSSDATKVDSSGRDGSSSAPHDYIPFYGDHQTGITATHQAQGLMAAFSVMADNREELVDTFRSLTDELARLMNGEPYPDRDPNYPPLYAGNVGNPPPPADLSVVTSVGASLFDGRFGLADLRPTELREMPFLANDRLDPTRSHGDLLLSIASASQDVNLFALRQLMRATRATLTLKWTIDGFSRRVKAEPGEAGTRNLMGFVDGTVNIDPTDDGQMNELTWVGEGDGHPAWAAGGTYQVVRVIRMFVEFWDRTRLREQEDLIGRQKSNGAPLDGQTETDAPDFAADPDGKVTPHDAHIRLANPRTPETAGQRILRKGFSFSRGFDSAGQLDQGLAFVSYQRSIDRQFMPIQERLVGEPLEEYILPQGGGFFYVLPGVPQAGGFLGQGLLAG
jgi:deferrochelatase/peroxidase EfeB